jgi:hypothetical protein
MRHFESLQQLETVVDGFESCTTDKNSFAHEDHLTVAVWFLRNYSEAEALERMRDGLHRFLSHHAVDPGKYNETITQFWLKIVNAYLARLNPSISTLEATNAVLDCFSNSRLVFEYYSETLLHSEAAKRGWVEPDLKSFEN